MSEIDYKARSEILDSILLSDKWEYVGTRWQLEVRLAGEKDTWTAVRTADEPSELIPYYDLHEKIGWNACGATFRIIRFDFQSIPWPIPAEPLPSSTTIKE